MAVEIIHFVKSQSLKTRPFSILWEELGNNRKAVLCILKCGGRPEKSACVMELQAEWAAFSMEHHFYLKRTTDRQGMIDYSDLDVWQTFPEK